MNGDSSDEAEVSRQLLPVKPGTRLSDKYVVGRVLGRGGMGVVAAAYDELLDRQVAVKFLLPRLAWSDRSVQRFMREARAATRVTSEHAVKLLEIGKLESGVPFFVMEYLVGETLESTLRRATCLPVAQAVDYVLQAMQAVAEGHAKQVVHRDIKPSNLFLTRRADDTPLIKVLDFGIAKLLPLEESEQRDVMTHTEDGPLGSPPYMSPEQLFSPREVDKRSDIWSLGVTLYELLSGNVPFGRERNLELMANVMNARGRALEAPANSEKLPPELVEVVWRCLRKHPQDRFADAVELARALAPFGTEDGLMSLRRIQGVASVTPKVTNRLLRHGMESLRGTSTTLSLPPEDLPRHGPRLRITWPLLVLGGACALLAVNVGLSRLNSHRESAHRDAAAPTASPVVADRAAAGISGPETSPPTRASTESEDTRASSPSTGVPSTSSAQRQRVKPAPMPPPPVTATEVPSATPLPAAPSAAPTATHDIIPLIQNRY